VGGGEGKKEQKVTQTPFRKDWEKKKCWKTPRGIANQKLGRAYLPVLEKGTRKMGNGTYLKGKAMTGCGSRSEVAVPPWTTYQTLQETRKRSQPVGELLRCYRKRGRSPRRDGQKKLTPDSNRTRPQAPHAAIRMKNKTGKTEWGRGVGEGGARETPVWEKRKEEGKSLERLTLGAALTKYPGKNRLKAFSSRVHHVLYRRRGRGGAEPEKHGSNLES